jgi:two-component system OmpR family sensor kinase
MSATGSSQTSRIVVALLVGAGITNIVLMYVLPGAETIPFHLAWIGLSIVYGLTTWRLLPMVLALGVIAVSSGYILIHHAEAGAIGWEETTEVPLMSAVFAVMVWHVRRHQRMTAEVARLAESERRHASARDRFVRLASHELRTPITIARGYAELVGAAASDPAVQQDTRIVLEELDRLAGITQRLVTLVQIDGTEVRTVGDVDAALADVVRRWRPAADRCWTIRSAIGQASFNPDRLKAALDSLLENAIKFTVPGDRVEVVGTGTDDAWTVAVVDSGAGMSAECLAALTADSAVPFPAVTASGTGLGLAIVRAVVKSWNGRLEIHSEPGAGTSVTLHFPRHTGEPRTLDVAPSLPAAAGSS